MNFESKADRCCSCTKTSTTMLLQEEGLRAVACKRLWRLVRQAARVWTEAVRRAREARAAEQRLLNALKRVNVGMHARPPRPFRAPGASASPEVCHRLHYSFGCIFVAGSDLLL